MSVSRVIARNTGVQAAADLLGKVASLAFYVVMARELGQRGFGDFTFALSLALVLTMFAEFGTDEMVTRTVAVERGTARQLLTDALLVKLGFGLLGVVVAVVVAFAGGYSAEVRAAVAILAVAAVVELLAKSFYAIFQALDDMAPIAASFIVQRYVTAVVGIVALLAGAGVVAVAAIYLGGALLALAYGAWRLARHVRPSPARVIGTRSRARARLRGAGGPRSAADGAVPARRGDPLPAQGQRRGGPLRRRLSAAREHAVPLLHVRRRAAAHAVAARHASRRRALGDTFELGLKLIASALLAVGTCFALFAEPMVHILYSSAYDEAIPAVRLLGAAAAFYGVSYLAAHVLIAQRRQRVLPWITLVVLVLNVGLNLLVIPAYSFKGAAAVTSVSEIALAAGVAVVRPADHRRRCRCGGSRPGRSWAARRSAWSRWWRARACSGSCSARSSTYRACSRSSTASSPRRPAPAGRRRLRGVESR